MRFSPVPAQQLQVVVSDLVREESKGTLLEIGTTLPTPHYFDATGLSNKPRQLTYVRTVELNQTVNFLTDLLGRGV